MLYDCDILVIGTGAGGGTLAAACARAGKHVIVVERGRLSSRLDSPMDERSALIDKQPYDDRPIALNSRPSRLFMGGMPGGGTAVYGAALLRPSPADFHPGEFYGERLPRCLWDWPIAYDELSPYYDQAECQYRVAVDHTDDFSPLGRPCRHLQSERLPLAPINGKVRSSARDCGLRPFQLPLAIDSSRCLRCDSCAGFPCPTGARRSARNLVDEATTAGHRIELLAYTEVDLILPGASGRIQGVRIVDRVTGASRILKARRYVLGAGALASAALLIKSGYTHRELGCNYMMHYSPVVVGMFLRRTQAGTRFVKQLGFADYYFGTKDCPEKMGIVQSLPAPGQQILARSGVPLPRLFVSHLRNHMLPLVGIVEDLPNRRNRVTVSADGQMSLHHRFSDFDESRGAALARAMERLLRKAGAVHCISRSFPSAEHVAHQCGTVRFGLDPRHSVADKDGRLYLWPDVVVCDGSLLPTSLGVGPALTIMANSLRLADTLITDC